ncbi:MAG: DUF3124 domain-containing protein [Flavisolibacter sp.]|nr:DUF3124 domain-containing protein [Flavisolibacter sp.]
MGASVIVLPMHPIGFVVEHLETEGDARANFVVKWVSPTRITNQPLIQTMMNEHGPCISFITNGA